MFSTFLYPFFAAARYWRRRISMKSRAISFKISQDNADRFDLEGSGQKFLDSLIPEKELQLMSVELEALPSGWAAQQALRQRRRSRCPTLAPIQDASKAFCVSNRPGRC